MRNDYFDNVLNFPKEQGEGITEDAREQFEKKIEDEYAISKAYNDTFCTEQGQKVLNDLKKKTIEGTTWNWELGYKDAVANGFAREGQNSMYRYIDHMIELKNVLKKKMDNEGEGKK